MSAGPGAYRLVALDIDGTVLDSEGKLSAMLKDLVPRLAERAIRTVLCTGRRWRTAMPVVEQLQSASTCVVCSGGALIKELDGNRTLYASPLAEETARLTADLYRQRELVPVFLYDRPLEEPELLVSESDRVRAARVKYLQVNRDAVEMFEGECPDRGAPLVVLTVAEAGKVERARDRIQAALGDSATVRALRQPRYGGMQAALEVHGPDATKWSALEWLMRRWHILPAQVIAVGDDVNDIPMLRAAGLSFAMGNAPDEVKAAADAVTGTNDEHGAAKALGRVLQGM